MSRPFFAIPLVALLLAAGCVAPGPEEVDAASTTPKAADAAAMSPDQPVSFDGSLGLSAFACPVATCTGQAVMPSERIFETPGRGHLDISLTLGWDTAAATTERLLFGVFTCDPARCRSDADMSQIEYVYGASPLTFEAGGFTVPDGETLFVFANVGGNSAGPVFANAATPQDFHVEGLLSPQP